MQMEDNGIKLEENRVLSVLGPKYFVCVTIVSEAMTAINNQSITNVISWLIHFSKFYLSCNDLLLRMPISSTTRDRTRPYEVHSPPDRKQIANITVEGDGIDWLQTALGGTEISTTPHLGMQNDQSAASEVSKAVSKSRHSFSNNRRKL